MPGTASDAVPAARHELPSGTVTFVFTDIEGSTKLAHELGTDRWRDVLVQHASVIRRAVATHEGIEVRTEGDSFFLAFRTARQAVAAAAEAERALVAQPWPHGATVRVRIGMHTGENARPGDTESGADYVGYDVHRAARVASAAHGGQVLLSSTTRMLLGDQLPSGVTLRDLGEHRLKDMSQPDRLHQLVIDGVPDAFPALRTLERAPNNLPLQLTSFIGRRKELAEARALLDRTHLLSLVGPGGTGKSRLSLELAAQVVESFPDGVWFVRLAAITDAALVASTIAHTLGLVVPPARTPLEHVIDQLRDKAVLLVMDNFEQVVAAAPDVSEILGGCSRVRVVVTTRIVLRVAGEQEYPVPPLTLPDPTDVPDVDELARAEAIQLFVERARATRPDFMLTADNARALVGVVAQLDGLPLAIELAAARVKILPPQAILERLASGMGILQSSARDLPARQQTLRGAIAWSYELLDPGLRRLFARLSVFRGGAALEQIEQVCGPSGEIDRDVLDSISELVDQSLLRRSAAGDEPRFVMLETIREFAREKLGESGEASGIERRHAHAYRDMAERFEPDLFGKRQRELLDRLDLEHANLRAAIARSSDGTDVETALRLVAALWRFWQMRGHLHEARERAEKVLALPGAESFRERHVRALEAAGGITYWLGDLDATTALYDRRLALAREIGDEIGIANACYDASFVFLVPNKEIDRGESLLDEALVLFRKHGDEGGVGKTLWGLTGVQAEKGRWDRAAEMIPEVIRIFRKQDNRFGLGWALHQAGAIATRLGDFTRAREHLAEGMALFVEANDLSGIVLYLFDFAELAAAQGQTDRALRLYGAMSALRDSTGSMLSNAWLLENTEWGRLVRELQERADPALRDRLIAEGRAMSKEDAISFALADGSALAS